MIGFTLIIFLAGLQGISNSLKESARVDGANFFQEIVFIVLPNLKPYMLIGGIWILINSLKVFVLPQVITGGGPGSATMTLYLYSWKLAFERLHMGEASQVAYLTAFIILFFTLILNLILKPETAQKG
jgi:ABC-type sugar transport system permease subunit